MQAPEPVQLPFIDVDRLASPGEAVQVIDLRSPSEFADDHFPGAINVPLFGDEERAFVGLLYKQFSPEAAFQEGRAAVAGSIERLVASVAEVAGWAPPDVDLVQQVMTMTGQGIASMEELLQPAEVSELPAAPIVLSCARGGLRSRSVVALLRSLGLDRAIGLVGGYRAYRHGVSATLADWTAPRHIVTLSGLTGVGKTLVLREVEALRPNWTLDLEGHAGHRSSLLGMVGLRPVTQKSFESALATRVAAGFPADVMVVEGESRKVGDVVIPASIWAAMKRARHLEITASVERRVRVLSEDYLADPSALGKLREQLGAVSKRMEGSPDLPGMLDRGETDGLVEILLSGYYDPLYRRSEENKVYGASIDSESPEQAARDVVAWVEACLAAGHSAR